MIRKNTMVHHILIVTFLSLFVATVLPNPSRILVAHSFSKNDQTEHRANNPQPKNGLCHKIVTWYESAKDDTPLHTAARFNNVAEIKRVLESDIDPNLLNCKGMNALYIAAKKGYTETVRALLADERTNPNLGFKSNNKNAHADQSISPLWIAVYKGHREIIKMLLASTQIEPENGNTVIFKRENHTSKFYAKTNASFQKIKHKSPLETAQEIGNTAIIELLS